MFNTEKIIILRRTCKDTKEMLIVPPSALCNIEKELFLILKMHACESQFNERKTRKRRVKTVGYQH